MARKRRTRDDALDDADEAKPARRRGPRWRLRIVVVLALILALILAGPAIVAKTPLRNLVLSRALPSGAGSLACRDAGFSWVGGQSLTGVTLTDAAGNSVLTAESVTLDRSLAAIALNHADLGKITIARPIVHIETRPGGSNLEDLAQKFAAASRPAAPQAADAPDVSIAAIEIVDGAILGRDPATASEWRVDQLAATARPAANVWEASATGVLSLGPATVTSAPVTDAGRFKFDLRPADAGRQQASLIADRLPLAPLEPWLARVLPGSRIVGTASTDVKLAWVPPTGGELQLAAAGKVNATDLRFTTGALTGDLVDLPTASLSVDAALVGNRLAATQLYCKSDTFQVEANGNFDLARIAAMNWQALPAGDAGVTARVDVARLAHMLPRTLHLRPGVQIDSGSVEVAAKSARDPAAGARQWKLTAAVRDLVGRDGTREIRWTQPVEATLEAGEPPSAGGAPQLQHLNLQSPFATAQADATADGVTGKLQFDLDQLATQLGQFVDLSAWKLAGVGEGQFVLKPSAADVFTATAALDLKQIDVRQKGKPVWLDPQLHVELTASGRREGIQPRRIDAGALTIRGLSDSLTAELLEPVAIGPADQNWFVKVQGDGALDSWAGRLRPWMAGVPEQLAGQSTLAARVRARAGFVEVVESQLSVADLRLRSGDANITEPRVEAGGDFRWDAATSSVESQNLQLATSAVAARARGLTMRVAAGGPPTMHGDIAIRGDFERLAAWGLVPGVGPSATIQPHGQAVGRIQLASDAASATANITLTSEPFQLTRAGGTAPVDVWKEPRLEFAAAATYTSADDRLQLANLKLQGQTVQLAGAGSIEQLRSVGLVRGDVNVTYDATQLASLLSAYLGPNVKFQGANTARLQAAGPLFANASLARTGTGSDAVPLTPVSTPPSSLQAPASSLLRTWQLTSEAGWSAASVFGLAIGPAKVAGTLRDGQIQFNPLDLAVGQGRITLQPRLLLDPPPQMLQLPAGSVASNVEISAEVSEAMLKYAAPMLAGAARTEGAFSLFLDGLQTPLADPKQTRAVGRLTIHRLSVVPGPMIQDIAGIMQQLDAVSKRQVPPLGGAAPKQIKGVTMTERTIDVQIQDGRVYHRNLEFMIDDVPVRSYGSVGFDQTLALVLEIPVQAKWIGREPALQGLIGQIIQIPVSGTFDQPKADQRAVANFVGQAAQTAVGGAIGGELNKALDKIFRPK